MTAAASGPVETTGPCTGADTCSAQQVETFQKKAFFPPKNNSWLKLNVSQEGAVLTTTTTAQKCEGCLWDGVGSGLLADAGLPLLLSLINGKHNSPLSL